MKNHRRFLVLGVLLVVAAFFGGRAWLYSRHHVTTDNAQVDGRLATIAPRLQGYVAEVRVEDNQVVRAGDTLLVMETADLDAAVAGAAATVAAGRARTGQQGGGELGARIAAARATAAAAEAAVTRAGADDVRAAADLERTTRLAAKQIVPAQQLDAMTAARASAAAQLAAARKQYVATEAQVSVAASAREGGTAELAAAEAALEAAQLHRAWAVLTAPTSGIVSHRSVDPGSLLQSGQTAMIVVPTTDIWVTANIKETALGRVAVGDHAEFTVDGYDGMVFTGTVASVAPATGARFALLPPDNATGNFTKVVQNVPVRIAVATPPDPAHPLRPGMSVDVAITIGDAAP